MANEPLHGQLYISDPINRQIITVKSLDQALSTLSELKSNWKSIDSLCTSFKCEPGRPIPGLINPKSVSFDTNGLMYFIDQNQVKSMSGPSRVVTTVIGGESNIEFKPIECGRASWRVDEMRLRWPTSLAVNPIDNSLFVLDDGDAIYKVTTDRVELVAGVPSGCFPDKQSNQLSRVVDMAFGPDGDLFVLENDQVPGGLRQIRVIKSTSGQIDTFVDNSKVFVYDSQGGKFAGFNDPISIAVHQNRSVYVLDRGDNVLYHVRPSLLRDEEMGKYTLVSAETREAYVFNRFGLHMHTLDLSTGTTVYNFTYNGNALYGKLTSIGDQTKTILVVKRDFHGRAESMQTSNGFTMRVSRRH